MNDLPQSSAQQFSKLIPNELRLEKTYLVVNYLCIQLQLHTLRNVAKRSSNVRSSHEYRDLKAQYVSINYTQGSLGGYAL